MTDGPKEWKKPEVKEIVSEEPGKDKAELTDEQKGHIRADLEEETYDTKEKARKRRKQLAIFYGTTVEQIGAVSAYKKGEDDKLILKPKFEKPPPAPPQIEAVYDNPTKRAWREKIRDAIKGNFTEEELKNARVVCLPGQALQEVTEVYAQLGIQAKNITCIESDQKVARKMRAAAKTLKLPVTIFEGTVEKFLQSPHEPIAIASFDFLGPMHKSFLESFPQLRTAEKFIVITNFLQKREQKDSQINLRMATSVRREGQGISRPDFKDVKLGSEFLDSIDERKDYFEHVEDVVTGRTQIELSDARDEGVAPSLIMLLAQGRLSRFPQELYAEVDASPPSLAPNASLDFLDKAPKYVATTIEREFEKYPGLFKKLTPIREVDATGNLTRYSNRGKHGFLHFLGPVISECFISNTLSDVQRYEYASETAGSHYQTDIVSGFDWNKSFGEKHRAAYDFIRECFRAIGSFGKDTLTIRLEKSGKTLRPQTYSGSSVGLTLVLCVNGTPRSHVSLHNLQQLVNYHVETAKIHMKVSSQELLARPRIEIKA